MKKSEQINELAAALSKAQGQIKNAAKDSANPFFKSRYADLASVWDACRAELSANGLAVVQVPESRDGQVGVYTILLHSSGQWVDGELFLTPVKDDPQGAGSIITYCRRYSLCGFAGIAPEDDDGNAASGKTSSGNEQVKRSFGSAAWNKPSADKPLVKANSAPAAETTTLPLPIEDIGIDKGQAANLHRGFRAALRPDLQPKAERLLQEWLTKRGFVDADGKASTLKIPRDLFGEFQKEITDYAVSL